MKKLSIILIVALLVLSTVGLVACGGDGNKTVSTTVTFKNGSEIIATSYCDGVTLAMPTDPAKDGFTFGGWFKDESFTAEFNKATYIADNARANLTLYAKFTINEYTITFEEKGGSEVDDITADYNATVTLLTTTKKGYTFNGWSTTEDGKNIVTYTAMPAENVTLYAVFTINRYTITFNEKSGSEVDDITDDYNTVITLPTSTLANHTFKGWSTTEDGKNIVTYTNMPAEDGTLYAVFTINRYTITFEEKGGSEVDDITADYDSSVTLPETSTLIDYAFMGWSWTDGGESVGSSIDMPLNDVTLYAIWKATFTAGLSYTDDSNGGYSVVKGSVKEGEVVLPSFHEGKPVTSIANSGFQGTSITSIMFGNNIISLGESAFNKCASLASIIIPNSVTTIGAYAFYGCTTLASITIPDSVTTIEAYAFNGCTALVSITIPNGVTTIENSTFQNCKLLTSIIIPNSVTTIGNSAFSYCTALVSITIPNSVTSIGTSVFSNCQSLASITIPNGVTSIGESAFNGCASLSSITIPNNITSIGNSAFSYCTALANIIISNSVTTIGAYAFSNCTSLASITIPKSVTGMGRDIFVGCVSSSLIINVEIIQAKPSGWDAKWNDIGCKVNWGV